MKSIMLFLLAIVIVLNSSVTGALALSTERTIYVDMDEMYYTIMGEGVKMKKEDFPFRYKGVTYWPAKYMDIAVGMEANVDLRTETIRLSGNKEYAPDSENGGSRYGERHMKTKVRLANFKLIVNGSTLTNKLKSIVVQDKIFLPLRGLVEAVGGGLLVDKDSSTVHIYPPVPPIPGVQTQIIKTESPLRSLVDDGDEFLHSSASLAPSAATHMDADGTLSVAWDNESQGTIGLATLDSELKVLHTFTLEKEMPQFGNFTRDEQGNWYVLWGLEVEEKDKQVASIQISKYSETGDKMGEVRYAAGDYDIREPFIAANVKLQYANGLLVAFFGGETFESSEGHSYFTPHALFVEAEEMKPLKLPIPYSAYSFELDIAFDGDNVILAERGAGSRFRGFALTKINRLSEEVSSFVPFHFKLAKEGYFVYTFSQLGGIAATDSGYVLVGSSEKTMSAARAKKDANESRNLFLQLIDKNIDLVDQPVLSVGDTQTVDIDYYGNPYPAVNSGVVWLTGYHDKKRENVANPKVVSLEDDQLLIMWENMGTRTESSPVLLYRMTYYMIVKPDGSIVRPATEIKGARLNRGDSIRYHNGFAYWATDSYQGITLYKLDLELK